MSFIKVAYVLGALVFVGSLLAYPDRNLAELNVIEGVLWFVLATLLQIREDHKP